VVIKRPTKEMIREAFKSMNKKSAEHKRKHFLSDDTRVGNDTWRELRDRAMKKDYSKKAWYESYTDEDKKKFDELREAQVRQNDSLPLTVQRSKYSDQSVLAISIFWIGFSLNDSKHKAIISKHLPARKEAKDNTK